MQRCDFNGVRLSATFFCCLSPACAGSLQTYWETQGVWQAGRWLSLVWYSGGEFLSLPPSLPRALSSFPLSLPPSAAAACAAASHSQKPLQPEWGCQRELVIGGRGPLAVIDCVLIFHSRLLSLKWTFSCTFIPSCTCRAMLCLFSLFSVY